MNQHIKSLYDTIELAWRKEVGRRWKSHVADATGTVDALAAIEAAREQIKRRKP